MNVNEGNRNMSDTIILGIESSCDETAAAVVKNGRIVLSDIVNSQIGIHQHFGGVVPEVASRKHIENIALVVDRAFTEAGLDYSAIDAVAVTNRPGLIGALLVGLSFAKSFAYGLDVPLIAVNHLQGHVYANFMEHEDIVFPAVCLIVSGGHTSLQLMNDRYSFATIGQTSDDAAGEALDKVARFLGLGYPGGPAIEKAAVPGTASTFKLPRVFLDRKNFDFSFSGLKTAAMNEWNKLVKQGNPDLTAMVTEFQQALVDILAVKAIRAARHYSCKTVMLAGGVACNQELRRRLREEADNIGIKAVYPSLKLCTDNAVMIAGCAYHDYRKQLFAPLDINAQANLD